MNKYLKYLILILFFSCKNEGKTDIAKIRKLIRSNNVNEIVEGYFIIGEEKQTIFIKDMFLNINDARISHHYKFKGISIYQSKLIALKKISGLDSPFKITRKPDCRVIKFYYKWALKNNFINIESHGL
jgi:hypothetical protein